MIHAGFGAIHAGLPSQSHFVRQLPQRGSPWQAGPLPTGRLRLDRAQKGGPCYRGQRLLDKRTLSSCRWPRQRSTTVSDKWGFARPGESCPTRQWLPLWGSWRGAPERASRLSQSRYTAISRLFVRAILSRCFRFSVSVLALSVCCADTSPKGRGFGIPEGTKNPLSELQLREGVFFCFGEHHEYSYLLCFYYMPFPAKVKRCTESLQAYAFILQVPHIRACYVPSASAKRPAHRHLLRPAWHPPG